IPLAVVALTSQPASLKTAERLPTRIATSPSPGCERIHALCPAPASARMSFIADRAAGEIARPSFAAAGAAGAAAAGSAAGAAPVLPGASARSEGSHASIPTAATAATTATSVRVPMLSSLPRPRVTRQHDGAWAAGLECRLLYLGKRPRNPHFTAP